MRSIITAPSAPPKHPTPLLPPFLPPSSSFSLFFIPYRTKGLQEKRGSLRCVFFRKHYSFFPHSSISLLIILHHYSDAPATASGRRLEALVFIRTKSLLPLSPPARRTRRHKPLSPIYFLVTQEKNNKLVSTQIRSKMEYIKMCVCVCVCVCVSVRSRARSFGCNIFDVR